LITEDLSPFHIVDVNETFAKNVSITVLNKNDYIVINNPIDDKTGKKQNGSLSFTQRTIQLFLETRRIHPRN